MEPMLIVRTAAILLTVTALGGVAMVFTVGLPGTAALGLLLLVLAALGGVYLNLAFHWKQVLLPKGIVIVHTLLAVVGFVLVLLAAFR